MGRSAKRRHQRRRRGEKSGHRTVELALRALRRDEMKRPVLTWGAVHNARIVKKPRVASGPVRRTRA